jgi:signal transduction histidine kinase
MSMHMITVLGFHYFPRFTGPHATFATLIAVVLMVYGLLRAREGLRPFRSLREALVAVRKGQEQRIKGAYPSEVEPLIQDLNALLDDREKAVKRAFSTAGDLAHGLKTPLALLAQEADRASAAGNTELAESITHQVERMTRQVNYHLARARAAASGPTGATRCPVAECTDALVRTLQKLHATRALELTASVPVDLNARVQREDLEEILGNVLDNACKWAKSAVVLHAAQSGEALQLTIDDDGPGLAPELRTVALERGVRIDEAAPGSGLGLAIVRDLAELYGGSVTLEDSPLGGLRARVTLPMA